MKNIDSVKVGDSAIAADRSTRVTVPPQDVTGRIATEHDERFDHSPPQRRTPCHGT
ncbi:hypothetical protein [Streptomyces sp. NPDC002573]|uniref:hypothetical protein n=1 Tax=Streptomyces sp. NPDC002573 TaxID=3364651 RepID=UPI00368CC4C2